MQHCYQREARVWSCCHCSSWRIQDWELVLDPVSLNSLSHVFKTSKHVYFFSVLTAQQGNSGWQLVWRSAAAHHQHGQLQSPSLVLLLFQLWELCVLTSHFQRLTRTPSFPSTPHPPPPQYYWLISWTDGTRISPADCCSRCWRAALQRGEAGHCCSSAEAQLQFETQFVCFFLSLLWKINLFKNVNNVSLNFPKKTKLNEKTNKQKDTVTFLTNSLISFVCTRWMTS